MDVLHLVLQFSEAVRVWTSSFARSLPGCCISSRRGQDSAMRRGGRGTPSSDPAASPSITNYMGLWTELSSLSLCAVLNYLKLESYSSGSMLHIIMEFLCLRLVSQHIYHRKQHCSLCKIKEQRNTLLLLHLLLYL